MESIQDILANQSRGLGVLRDELSGFIGQMDKYASGGKGGSDRAFFLQAYNGGSHVVDRVGRGTVVIDKVLPGSPAEQVGIAAGDVFVSLDDFPVQEQGDVVLVISGKQPGEWVKVRVRRGGEEMIFAPLLALPPDPPAQHHAKPYHRP